MRPLFSIVIPTRDRPNLLKDAIQSALEQEFDDYEVIVSDNSTNSDTQKVVSEFQSNKLKYFRTPKPLDMPRSWDFALSKANGKFINILGDDDLLPKKFLHLYYKIVNLKENRNIKAFFHEHSSFTNEDNSKFKLVVFMSFRKNLIEILDPKSFFRMQITWGGSFFVPQVAFINKSFYDFIKNKYGRCFFNWAPDISFSYVALYELSRENEILCKVNMPLLIARDTSYSYGYGSRNNPNKVKEFLYQFEEFKGKLIFSPYKTLFTLYNTIYDTYLNAFNIIGEKEVYRLAGKDAIRDFHRRFFIKILDELVILLKKDEFYKNYHRKVKRDFMLWKLRNFIFGLIQDRKYVKDVIASRIKHFLGIKNEKHEFYHNLLHYDVSDLHEALRVVDSIIDEKLKELG